MATVNWQALGGGVLDGLFTAEALAVDVGDRYEVLDPIGAGGQGTVYRARDTHLNREVAIKVAHGVQASRLLLAEAALLARLTHPAIPAVFDSGRGADGRTYLVMELVEGQPLHRVLRQNDGVPLVARLRIMRAVVGAVAHAHQRGILHRDCKPANIMVRSDGEAMLIDWGLAATGDPRAICGTPSYAAPEQLSGQVADRRSDVYALGVLLYELLSGELPYARVVDDFDEFRRQRAGLGLIPLRARCPDLPSSFQRIIDRAMAAQPAARYERCEHLLDDLDALMSGRPTSQDPRPWRWTGLMWVALLVVSVNVAFWAGRQWAEQTSAVVVSDGANSNAPSWVLPPQDVPAGDGSTLTWPSSSETVLYDPLLPDHTLLPDMGEDGGDEPRLLLVQDDEARGLQVDSNPDGAPAVVDEDSSPASDEPEDAAASTESREEEHPPLKLPALDEVLGLD